MERKTQSPIPCIHTPSTPSSPPISTAKYVPFTITFPNLLTHYPQWRNFNTTLRWPTSSTLTAVSDQTRFLKSYNSQRRNLHDTIDAAFRRSTLNAFASTLEDTHGWVHGIIGGGWDAKSEPGHMWPLDYSAYEPMFMAHHTYLRTNPAPLSVRLLI
jgi:hypothetical protein